MPQQYTVRWIGGRIGQGASVFHFESIASGSAAGALATAVRGLFDARKADFSQDITWQFDSEVLELDNAGNLQASYPVATPAAITGSSTGAYTSGSGIVVRHNTGVILGGKRILGRTFMVPTMGATFDTNGDVSGTSIGFFNTAFTNFNTACAATGANFAVWSKANTATVPVLNSTTQPRPARLSSRNDRL